LLGRWYRCPELLLGARSYSTGCDNWAAGCIFAELMLRVPFMAAESDMEQLNMIFSALGTPSEADWPVRPPVLLIVAQPRRNALFVVGCPFCMWNTERTEPFPFFLRLQGLSKLANGAVFDKKPRSDLRMLFSAASPEAVDLMEKLLTFDPRKRITAKEVRPFFLFCCIPPSRLDLRRASRMKLPDVS
jgi:cyclin-dependent kinase 7